MSTNKKFRIQNGVDIHGGGLSIDDVTVIGADGKVVQSAIADAVAGLTSSDIADLQAQVSAILGTSPETLDTLQEIVTAFENADSSLTASVAANTAAHEANSAAIAAANSRTSGISTSSGSSNIQMSAEVDMDSNKVTNMADPTAAQDAATKAYVDAASATSGSGLSTETAARIAGDNANSGEIVAAEARLNQGHSADADFDGVSAQSYNIQSGSGYNVDINAGNDFIVNATDDVDLVADDATYITSTNGKIDLKAGSYIEMDGDTYIKTGHSFRLQDDFDGDNPAMMSFIQDLSFYRYTQTAVPSAAAVWDWVQLVQSGLQSHAENEDSDHWVETAKPYIDAGDATVQAAVDVVSGRVDAILNGAGESLDTIVEVVAAFENADSDIQALITGNSSGLTNEINRATAAEANLQSQITAEVSARTSGDSDLTAALAAETAAREAADLLMADDISGEATNRQAADAALQSDIDDEVAARIAAVSAEATQRNAADASLQSQINSLSSGTSSDVSDLQGQIDAEEAARIAADAVLQGNIDAEAATRASADATLTSDLADEVSRATAAEGVIAADLVAEITARTNGDASLQSQINSIVSNTDPAALDSLTEIVAAFQAADGSITGVVNSNTSRISALETGVTAIEAWSTDNVSEGSTNLYFTDARAKACLSGGLCITYNSSTGEIKVDEAEAESSLRVAESVASDDADKLDGQEGTYYRINVYNVAGSLVN